MASTKLEIAGTVHAIPSPRKSKDGTKEYPFFVLACDPGKYEQLVPFDAKDEIIAKINVGDEVNVSFNLRGREWTNPKTGEVAYFGSNQAWKVEVTKSSTNAPPPEPNGGGWGNAPPGEPDDIPF